jgi:hypothetical protein
MANHWETHVLEPGKTYDELDTVKRPFESTTAKDQHVEQTIQKYMKLGKPVLKQGDNVYYKSPYVQRVLNDVVRIVKNETVGGGTVHTDFNLYIRDLTVLSDFNKGGADAVLRDESARKEWLSNWVQNHSPNGIFSEDVTIKKGKILRVVVNQSGETWYHIIMKGPTIDPAVEKLTSKYKQQLNKGNNAYYNGHANDRKTLPLQELPRYFDSRDAEEREDRDKILRLYGIVKNNDTASQKYNTSVLEPTSVSAGINKVVIAAVQDISTVEDKKMITVWKTSYKEDMDIIVDEEDLYLKMHKNKTYQFVMLLASFSNERMEKFFDLHNDSKTHAHMPQFASGMGVSINRKRDNPTWSLYDWYHNVDWADGLIHLAPMLYGHIEIAYRSIQHRWEHLENVPLQAFIESEDVRSTFARLVVMCMRTSDVLSGRRYHLQSTYTRVNFEKQRLMFYWGKVKYTNELVYDRNANVAPSMRSTMFPGSTTSSGLVSYIGEPYLVRPGLNPGDLNINKLYKS